MDFNIRNLWSFEIGGVEIWITLTNLNTWIIMLFLVLTAVILRIAMGRMKEVPGKVQNVVEAVIEAFENFVKSMAGERASFVSGWFFMVFIFILVSNLSGILGLRPPTADWATTFALALATFALIQVLSFYFKGPRYFLYLLNPLNLIGELARPISLSFRLFGNLLAGLIIMTLFYSLTPIFVQFGIPVFLHAFFDVFTGVLQTYIFVALSLAFIGSASSEEA